MRNMMFAVMGMLCGALLIAGCAKNEPLKLTEADVLDQSIPPSSDTVYVAVYRDVVVPIASGDRKTLNDRAKKAIEEKVTELKMKAFQDAAADILHALPQPTNIDEYQRAVDKAAKDFQIYLQDWKLVEHSVPDKKSTSVTFTAFFRVDKDALRRALVKERAVAEVAKYKTYFELYWNVPNKNISPDICNTIISRFEDYFAQAGYEVVQFDRIKGKLLKMLQDEGREPQSLYSLNELESFKANLDLRNIAGADSLFVNGKQILADYANVLVGVTVNTVEVTPDRMLSVRLAANTTLFENGEWLTLAAADRASGVPFVKGSEENMIQAADAAVKALCEDLEPKITSKLALRTDIKATKTQSQREFRLMFPQHNTDEFDTIQKTLKNVNKWEIEGVDVQARTVRVGYRGRADQLGDLVETALSGAGIGVTPPQVSAEGDRIAFGKK